MAQTIQYRITLLLAAITALTYVTPPSGAAPDGGDSEISALLNFKNSLSNDAALSSWNDSVSPCNGNDDRSNWIGVICSGDGKAVEGLQLEGMGLGGLVDVDSLAGLPALRFLSFMNNSFDGPFPEINKVSALTEVYLSDNKYSGEIPDGAFEGMSSLRSVYLARNEFSGEIPESLAPLTEVVELRLEGNQFSGKIPELAERDWEVLDLANNQLEGSVPSSLSDEDPSVFAGNKDLCGKPLKSCKSSKKLILIIIAITVATVVVLGIIVVFCCIQRQAQPNKPKQAQAQKNIVKEDPFPQPHTHNHKSSSTENEKLFFVTNDREKFEVEDLLKASAEILGSGSLGSSYKAALLNGPAMVVKRFRQIGNVGRDEFHEHMKRIGSFSHPNLLPLVAFYYRKEEKLLISDFVENGSLATHLHGKRAAGEAGLDWPTRLGIVKGVARGLAYLYQELPELTLPHGHLKSTNVLLDRTFQPLLTDYSLAPVVNKEHAHRSMVAYKSPESNRATRKTDVWSLGILILEILTGKDPAAKQGKSGDLAAWVNSVVREEWTGEVFEKEMKGTRRGEGEMLKLLKIGMCCCEWREERRWDLRTAAEKIEDLKQRDGGADDVSSSFASEADFYSSSRAVTDDEFSFSVVASPV